ncbi:MAG TPA: OmpH family outer membrane protein [Longimicrobiales bacterium]|nr:OmpH family outer membrane protein [Longimicrobiales bacterium]
MLRLLTVLAATAAIASAASPAAAQTPEFKIAILDSRVLIASAPGAQEAQAAFEADLGRYQAELQTLENELTQMIMQYDQQQAVLAADARQRQQDAIADKQRQLETRAMELENQASQRQAELVGPIMDRISNAIEEVRRELGYALVLDVAAGVVVAADPAIDITEQVVARMTRTASNQ